MTSVAKLLSTACCLTVIVSPGLAQGSRCASEGWIAKPDAAFAADCADFAFDGGLADRERLAWMFFARVNQLIDDAVNGGMSGTGKAPLWMAWPTDPDTFPKPPAVPSFAFGQTVRSVMRPSDEKKDLKRGGVSTADPDGANEAQYERSYHEVPYKSALM